MKKFLILSLSLFGGLISMAQPSLPELKTESNSQFQSLEPAARYNNVSLKKASPLPENPIYEAPAGDKVYYARTAYGYYYDWDTFTFGKREGGISIIYGEDGNAYIHNPISGGATNSYLQGVITEKGIEVTLPQLVLEESDFDNPGQKVLFYVAVMKCVDTAAEYVTYEVVEEDVTFLFDEDGNISYNLSQNQDTPDFEKILGLCDDRGNLYYGDAAQYLTEVTLNPVTPPAGLEYEDWRFYSDGDSHDVKLGFDGEDVYLCNFDFIYAPRKWIKGKVDGDYISFESGQFLEETGGFFYRFLAATYGNTGFSIEPEISFSYNREKQLMTTGENQYMVSNPVAGSISNAYPLAANYESPVMKLASAGITSNVPQNPKFVAYLDMIENAGMYFCEFDIYKTSVDYDPLPASQLYFKLFINDTPIENFDSSTGSVYFPYGYWGEDPGFMTILQLGTNVVMYLYFEGCETIGMQLINETQEGETFESDLVVYHVDSDTVTINGESGVVFTSTDEIVSSDCYDLNGLKCDPSSKGLHIMIDRHSDGSITTRKIMVK